MRDDAEHRVIVRSLKLFCGQAAVDVVRGETEGVEEAEFSPMQNE